MGNRREAVGRRLEGALSVEATRKRASLPPSTVSSLKPQASSLGGKPPRGISLIEVLISMFVLMIGLLGIAAMIPAGRFEVLQGAKVDHSTMVGRAAFRDLKIRGYLNPGPADTSGTSYWYDASGTPIWDYKNKPTLPFKVNGNNSNQVFLAIDPLGAAAGFGITFPASGSIPSLQRMYPSTASSLALADPVFRSGDDSVFMPNSSHDFPPFQKWFEEPYTDSNKNGVYDAGEPFTDQNSNGKHDIFKRTSVGDYSWLATIVTDPTSSALVAKVTVSVAVFYKRDLADSTNSERTIRAVAMPGSGVSGGEVVLYDRNNVNGLKPVKPGQWLMMAGTIYNGATPLNCFRWYRVVSASEIHKVDTTHPWTGSTLPSDMPGPPYQVQSATLAGTDWSAFPGAGTAMSTTAPNITWPYVWIIENVIAVYEKNMKLEIQ